MRLLVWQWGRFGSGPRLAGDFAAAFGRLPDMDAMLSLSSGAEIMNSANRPVCAMPVATYSSIGTYLTRVSTAPVFIPHLTERVRALAPDVALCAMPGPLDLAMHVALHRAGVPYAVVVHDADRHPGDGYPLQMMLQRRLVRRAAAVVVLSGHVAQRLAVQGLTAGKTVLMSRLPPPDHGVGSPPCAHGGKFRLLSFGRLLPYKGLDLLAESLALLMPRDDLEVLVAGEGPEGGALDALRRLPGVTVENRWVPEDEIGALLAWSDALVLTHREASQSGVAAAALAAGRYVISTRVGGLAEQLSGEPGALLCDADAASVANAVRRLVASPPVLPPRADDDWKAAVANLAEGLRALASGNALK